MTEKTLTTENIKPALDALRGELAPWPVVAKKQDRLNTAQLNAANSGITSSLVAQIIANTAAIRALESAITGTGLRALVVASLPAVGTTGILYIVPVTTYDPDTDADVVNYSNEYIWIPVEGGQASEGHYEQVGQTGIVINNGQLTITVNGTSVGTFTANQSGDTTAAITVPTNADYVDRTTDQTVAGDKTWTGEQSFTLPIVGSLAGTASKAIADEDGTSIKIGYVNVAGNQTVSGDKSFTGSNTFNNILPNATNTYSLGSSSYQWSAVYAQTYYYNGTAWGLDKANVWTGTNTFQQNIMYERTNFFHQAVNPSYILKDTGVEKGSLVPTAHTAYPGLWHDKNSAILGYMRFVAYDTGKQTAEIRVSNLIKNGALDPTGSIVNCTVNLELQPSGEKSLIPELNNDINLGTSTNQWKSVYAQTYFYNGTAWGLDKANVWTRSQTFTADTIYRSAVKRGTYPSSSVYMEFADYKDSSDNRISLIGASYEPNRSSNCCIYAYKTTQSTGNSIGKLGIGCDASGNVYTIAPTPASSDDSTQIATTAYVKSQGYLALNGINPGALSLPDYNSTAKVDISGSLIPDQYGNISYTPPINGWLYVCFNISNATTTDPIFYIQAKDNNVANSSFVQTSWMPTSGTSSLAIFFPVVANKRFIMQINFSNYTIIKAHVIPCLGNV